MAISFQIDAGQSIDDDALKPDTMFVPEGYYHVRVAELDGSKLGSGSPHLVVRYKILGGTAAGQEGNTVRDSLFISDKEGKTDKRLLWWAKICNILSGTGRQSPQWDNAVGRELIIRVVHKRGDDGQTFANVTRDGLWPVDHPAVAHVPKGAHVQQRPAQQRTPAQPASNVQPAPTRKPAPAQAANRFAGF